MREYLKFYINGEWVDPVTPKSLDVINPATEGVAGKISMGSAADVDRALGWPSLLPEPAASRIPAT